MDDPRVVKQIRLDRAELLNTVVGMSQLDAYKFIDKHAGFYCRVMKVDSKFSVGITNINMNRVNLHIISGVVTKAYFG